MARAKGATTPPTPAPAAPTPAWGVPVHREATPTNIRRGDRSHLLRHTPGEYMALDGWCVPVLTQFCGGEAGVAGVEAVRHGDKWRADPSEAMSREERRGVRFVPWDVDADDGHPSYLVPVGGTGTWTHRLQPQVPGMEPRPAPADKYAAWLLSLMERGILDHPHPEHIQGVREQLESMAQTVGGSKSQAQASRIRQQLDLYDKRAMKEQLAARVKAVAA